MFPVTEWPVTECLLCSNSLKLIAKWLVLFVIQVTFQLTDHSAIRLLLAIWLPDVSDN